MELGPLVRRYAQRFAAAGGDAHHVGSPLGAWVLLALAAPAAEGSLREQLTDALGTDVATAQQLVRDLLKQPHDAVPLAAATWTKPGLTGLHPWLAGLPPAVEHGDVPSQDDADAWAREHTLDLIRSFPLQVRDVVIVLATALATRVTWLSPFDLVSGERLRGPWSSLSHVLHAGRQVGHTSFVASTDHAGDVAVHSALADGGVEVTSVIAADDIPSATVLDVAHDIATRAAAGRHIAPRSLFDLPLGDASLWTITEQDAPARGEHAEAVLPAWRANSTFDLMRVPDLGLDAAAAALGAAARVDGPLDAAQVATARYTRRGFEAAAVSAVAVATSAQVPPPAGPYRTALLRFGHPFAVVATTQAAPGDPWAAVPVFAAWVAQPDDAADDD